MKHPLGLNPMHVGSKGKILRNFHLMAGQGLFHGSMLLVTTAQNVPPLFQTALALECCTFPSWVIWTQDAPVGSLDVLLPNRTGLNLGVGSGIEGLHLGSPAPDGLFWERKLGLDKPVGSRIEGWIWDHQPRRRSWEDLTAAEQNCMELIQLASQHRMVFCLFWVFFLAHYAAFPSLKFPRLYFPKQLDFRAVCGICQAVFDYFSNTSQAPWKSSTFNSFPAAEALLCIGNFGLQDVKGESTAL